ncbi:MAG TPA: alpha/beta hydrolase [Anaerolineales bacterium]|nr:alpha/beta hydrolase [Anaerolineales bacterium]
MLTERSFDTGEIVINFAEGDTAGPPLVMLHGSTLRWQTFGEFIPTLEQNWHIYACDLRGHGKSGPAISGYRIADFVPDTIAFIERFVGQPTILLGYSTGAMVTLGVAAHLPKLIRGIVLLEPPLMTRNTSIKQAESYSWFTWVSETLASTRTLEEVVARRKELEPDVPEIVARDDAKMILGIDPESIAYILNDRFFENFDLERVLPKVACPTLLVRGEPALGGLVRDSDVALLEAHIPQITTIQVSGTGHAVCWGPAGKSALEYVTQFLNSL